MVGDRGLRKAGWLAVFLLPSLLPLLAFTVGPMVASVGISTLEWNLISDARFVGFDNYRALLDDPIFRASLWHTIQYLAGYLPLVFVGGLGLALLLNRGLKGVALFRSIYFLPVVTSWVVVALVWRWLLSPSGGIVNTALAAIGIDGPGWWTDPTWAMPSVILASAWKDLGFVMVIFLAGLQAIPGEVEEAARVDGASAWQRFRRVTLPLLSPSSFFVVIISLINGFQVFDQVFVMTGGGPAGATTVVVEQVFTNAFRYGQMGYAAAMSWVLFAIILAVTLFQFRMQRRWVTYV
jgi:multiple sugar transport system permease protein